MKPKTQRLWFFILGTSCMGLALFIVLKTLEDNIVYFYTPSDLKSHPHIQSQDKMIRVGGYVQKGSLVFSPNRNAIDFSITDKHHTLPVRFQGILPSLFAEEQGVVAEGRLNKHHILVAERILAKHDENYTPPEIRP